MFLRHLSFCPDVFGFVEKKSKFVTSQNGKQLVTIHIFPNISRPKGNQKQKLDQLIDFNIFFPEKSLVSWKS